MAASIHGHKGRADRRVLVTGASGFVGARVVQPLIDRGWIVRVLVRDRTSIIDRKWFPDVECLVGDAAHPGDLRTALRDCSLAYYFLHSLDTGRQHVAKERQIAHAFARAAASANVRRIIYLGGFEPTGRDSRHLLSRAAVGDILLQSGVDTVALRAGPIIGEGSASFELMRVAVELPFEITGPVLSARTRPIAIADVVFLLVEAATLPGRVNRSIDIGGPEELSYAECLARIRRLLGTPPRPKVWWAGRVPPPAVDLFVARSTLDRNTVLSLVQGLRLDSLPRTSTIEVLPLPPCGLTRFDAAVSLALNDPRIPRGIDRSGLTTSIKRSLRSAIRQYRRQRYRARSPQVAFIMGGSSGIGLAVGRAFQDLGYTVVLAARWSVMNLPPDSPKVYHHRLDGCDAGAVNRLVDSVESTIGPIRAVVCAAGDLIPLPARDEDAGSVEDTFRQNVIPFVNVAGAVIPRMVERAKGSIACISSGWSLMPSAGVGGYAAAKAALTAYSGSLSAELYKTGVSVHVIYPGYYADSSLATTARQLGLREPHRGLWTTDQRLREIVRRLASGRAPHILHTHFLERIAPVIPVIFPRMYLKVSNSLQPFPSIRNQRGHLQ